MTDISTPVFLTFGWKPFNTWQVDPDNKVV